MLRRLYCIKMEISIPELKGKWSDRVDLQPKRRQKQRIRRKMPYNPWEFGHSHRIIPDTQPEHLQILFEAGGKTHRFESLHFPRKQCQRIPRKRWRRMRHFECWFCATVSLSYFWCCQVSLKFGWKSICTKICFFLFNN